jgi:hypothetical protein
VVLQAGGPGTKGSWDLCYLDEDLRVLRTNAGNVLALQRGARECMRVREREGKCACTRERRNECEGEGRNACVYERERERRNVCVYERAKECVL